MWKNRNAAISIKLAGDDIIEQLKILNEQYLGPHTDIEEASKAYVSWSVVCEENSAETTAGVGKKVEERLQTERTEDVYLDQLMSIIDKIDRVRKRQGCNIVYYLAGIKKFTEQTIDFIGLGDHFAIHSDRLVPYTEYPSASPTVNQCSNTV